MQKSPCILFLAFILLVVSASATESFDFGWRFAKGDQTGAEQQGFDDSRWRPIAVPHDWSIEGPYSEDAPTAGPGGYLPTGIGWYRKTFRVPESANGKKVTIQFDGVYMNSTIWINGQKLGTQPYGYTSFVYDLTPYLAPAGRDNVVAVRVDNSQQPNSRWYSGSGVYRHVWLRVTDPLHVPTWGVTITTPEISSKQATIHVCTEVRNDRPEKQTAKIELVVLDHAGTERARKMIDGDLLLTAGSMQKVSGDMLVPDPQLWSPDNPHLYRLLVRVVANGISVDETVIPFGIRKIEYDLNRGFLLNDEKVIMKGMCLHHDGGAVGAAVPDAVLRRRLVLLKEMGCNAVRASHNPMAPEFYDLCDELGLLVMDEIFDEWIVRKPQIKFGYSDFYKNWYEKDLVSFIRRNRNHPSIVMWSAGNEIGEQGASDGADVLRPLIEIFHREDPTRPVTAALDRAFTERGHAPTAFTELLDIVGYNYVDRWGTRRETHYSDDRILFPGRKFIGTENTSARSERGVYLFGQLARGGNASASPVADTAPQGALYLSSTLRAQALWKFVATNPYVAGDFAWTGFDYLGESRWPRKLSTSGALDTCGFKKDSFYLYQSIWTSAPMVHVLPHWNWNGKEGQVIPVLAYTNGNFAELFLNGRSFGVKAKEFPRQGSAGGWNSYANPVVQASTTDLHFSWDVPYEPGELRVVVYDLQGQIVAEDKVSTAGEVASLELSADTNEIKADGYDVAHVTVRALDANGFFVPLAADEVTFEISGPGRIIGVDNGDPSSHESYQGKTRALHAGMALVLIQSVPDEAGVIRLSARVKDMRNIELSIKSTKRSR